MVLSSLLGADINPIDVFFPAYTLEKLLLFPETALMPLRKDGEFIWGNYFINIYSILFSCWAHRFVLLLGQPDCDLKSVFFTVMLYIYFFEMYSLAWALAEMTPAYWGVLVILFLFLIFAFVLVFLYSYLTKLGFTIVEIEIKQKYF